MGSADMEWLEPALRNETYGLIAVAIAGAALLPGMLINLLSLYFGWRASRLAGVAKRFSGRKQIAEEQLSGMDAEEKDLRRLMREIEKTQAGG